MKMNATSLYVSTCRLIILADAADKSSWTDLFRLVPYLRQSLSCTVCGNLLKEPYTPSSSGCQHHVCKKCKGGRKKLKPSCSWCKDYDNYAENLQLRILLQCYKKLCEYFMGTDVYRILLEEDEIVAGVNGGTVASSGLIDLIQEGAGFSDDYKSTAGLSKSAYSILPCVYTNSASTQTQAASTSSNTETRSSSKGSPNPRAVSNGSPLYSVMYAGSGNKITIKRKAADETESSHHEPISRESKSNQLGFKKPSNRSRSSASSKRKGCRCGNATATPGKLTCCGQRCPCYVESKPCTECKCKGCRNPHRPDGMKVRPHIPQLDTLQLTLNSNPDSSPSCSGSMDSLDTDTLTMEAMEESLNFSNEFKNSNIKVYTSQLQEISASLPATIMMDEELPESPDDDMSSPQDYGLGSPLEADPDAASPLSGTNDVISDIEIMSQSRMRKAPAVGRDAGPRARVPLTQASGDTITPHPRPQNQQNKSKNNKIPKALRYDLENALVGLCDVWFEDIKPHLVRNNIKVHVHGAGAGDNQQQQEQLPPQAPGCSHLDPGAASDRQRRPAVNSAGCCSTQRTALKAQCRKPRASLQSSTLRQRLMQPYPNREGKFLTKTRVRQAVSPLSSPPKSVFNGLAPRLCHTYSIPSSITLIKCNSNSLIRNKDCKKKKLMKENKSTQTGHIPQCPLSVTPLELKNSQKKFHKTWATTAIAFYPSRCIRSRNGHLRTNNGSQLFQDDVIEIIGERHDKLLKLLYQNAEQEDYPSIMNLVRTPEGRRKPVRPKKCEPWR